LVKLCASRREKHEKFLNVILSLFRLRQDYYNLQKPQKFLSSFSKIDFTTSNNFRVGFDSTKMDLVKKDKCLKPIIKNLLINIEKEMKRWF